MRAFLFTIAMLLGGIPTSAADEGWTVEQNGAVRSRKLSIPPGKTGFTVLEPSVTGFTVLEPSVTGLHFTNSVDEWSSARNRTLENGAGVAAGDYNGDRRVDFFICGLAGGSALYENLGHWRFTNVTAKAGLPDNMPARGAVFSDVNGDALEDLLVVTLSEGVRCFTNFGPARFSEHVGSGLRTNLGMTTLALTDLDSNGTLDIYATTYRTDDIRDRARIDIRRVGGKVEVAPALRDRVFLTAAGLFESGEADIFYLNNGAGSFSAAPQWLKEGSTNTSAFFHDWGLAAAFRDWTADGRPDLFVCNDYWTPDRIFQSNESGELVLLDREAIPHASENSMGVDFGDINADGFLDIFVTDMLSRDHARRQRQAVAQATVPPQLSERTRRPHYMQNMLFLNRGDGTFAEIAQFAGIAASEWSWQPVFMDVDLDGYVDLLIPAGHTRDLQDLDATEKIRRLQHAWPPTMPADQMQHAFTRELMEHSRFYPRYDAPIVTFRNNGDLTFTDMTEEWGTAQMGVHQGIAIADFDADGDLDFVVNNLNSLARLYRNDSSAARVAIRLCGQPPNTAAAGAKVRVRCKNLPEQFAEVSVGGRYLSGSDTLLVFAASSNEETAEVLVTWPGNMQTRAKLRANYSYEIKNPRIESK